MDRKFRYNVIVVASFTPWSLQSGHFNRAKKAFAEGLSSY